MVNKAKELQDKLSGLSRDFSNYLVMDRKTLEKVGTFKLCTDAAVLIDQAINQLGKVIELDQVDQI